MVWVGKLDLVATVAATATTIERLGTPLSRLERIGFYPGHPQARNEVTVDSRRPSSLPHFKTFNPRAADVAAWVQIEAVAKTIDMGHIHQDPLFYAVPAPEYLCDNSYSLWADLQYRKETMRAWLAVHSLEY